MKRYVQKTAMVAGLLALTAGGAVANSSLPPPPVCPEGVLVC